MGKKKSKKTKLIPFTEENIVTLDAMKQQAHVQGEKSQSSKSSKKSNKPHSIQEASVSVTTEITPSAPLPNVENVENNLAEEKPTNDSSVKQEEFSEKDIVTNDVGRLETTELKESIYEIPVPPVDSPSLPRTEPLPESGLNPAASEFTPGYSKGNQQFGPRENRHWINNQIPETTSKASITESRKNVERDHRSLNQIRNQQYKDTNKFQNNERRNYKNSQKQSTEYFRRDNRYAGQNQNKDGFSGFKGGEKNRRGPGEDRSRKEVQDEWSGQSPPQIEDDTSRSSSDNYHITDEDSNDTWAEAGGTSEVLTEAGETSKAYAEPVVTSGTSTVVGEASEACTAAGETSEAYTEAVVTSETNTVVGEASEAYTAAGGSSESRTDAGESAGTDESSWDKDDWNAALELEAKLEAKKALKASEHLEEPKYEQHAQKWKDPKKDREKHDRNSHDYNREAPRMDREKHDRNSYDNNRDGSTMYKEKHDHRYSYEDRRKDPRMDREKQSENWPTGNEGSASKFDKHPSRWSDVNDVGKESCDKEYDAWEKQFWRMAKPYVFEKVSEIDGNLFEQPKDHSLAHCVAEDLRMGSGIAVDFKREFKNVDDLLNQRAKQGGLATLYDNKNNRYVYYLVTKKESTGKPTYVTVWKSLCKMRSHMVKHGVKKLAIPRLACGLDRLEWNRVKPMIEYIFRNVDVQITVCNFQQEEDAVPKRSITCKLCVEMYKYITNIEANTLILYFSTEDGHEDETMEKLSKKFNTLAQFQNRRNKKVGDFVYSENKEYGFGGCVVRKSNKDLLDFKGLAKCIYEINRKNKNLDKEAFEYVAYQWLDEEQYSDNLINQKVITLLINQLRRVDVYVCKGSFNGNNNNNE